MGPFVPNSARQNAQDGTLQGFGKWHLRIPRIQTIISKIFRKWLKIKPLENKIELNKTSSSDPRDIKLVADVASENLI